MVAVSDPLTLTAGDLMNGVVRTVRDSMPLADAARELTRLGVRGAPVVDVSGRCVGVLSVSDLARWVAGSRDPSTHQPRTCAFQYVDREPGGRETVVCLLEEGACPFQRATAVAGGSIVSCTEPHAVPTDWQVVVPGTAPSVVRDVMTTTVVSVGPEAMVPEIAAVMVDRGVHRALVLDPAGKPIGVVSVNDLLQVLAHPGLSSEAGA